MDAVCFLAEVAQGIGNLLPANSIKLLAMHSDHLLDPLELSHMAHNSFLESADFLMEFPLVYKSKQGKCYKYVIKRHFAIFCLCL